MNAYLLELLTYLFRLCFNQCNASLHFGSSKHSAYFQNWKYFSFTALFHCFNTGFTQQQPCFGSYFFFASLVGSQPCFPLGGVGYFFYVFPEICHSFLFVFHRQFFAFGACLPFPGASPDGSSLRLEHPHAWGHSSHSQLPIISFRAVGLETVETPQRTITVIF